MTKQRFVQAALNGDREHPAVPRTPSQIAHDAGAAVRAGARSVHVHVFDDDGRQTFAAGPVAATVTAIREACPGLPISLSTFAQVEPDPHRLRAAVASWTVLPDLVTANQGEAGIVDLCRLLVDRGIGIEAGLLSRHDAEAFVKHGIARHCSRVMVEPLDADSDAAVAHAAAIEAVVVAAGIDLQHVHHSDGVASWAVIHRTLPLGHGSAQAWRTRRCFRTGLWQPTTPSSLGRRYDFDDVMRNPG